MHRVLHARQIVINRIINSSNFCRCSQDDVSVPGQKGEKKKKSNNGSSLPYDGSSRELGFVPCQRSVATFHKKKKKETKKEERKKTKEITKKKERRRNNNNGISNCMLRAACDCVSVFLFFWKGRQRIYF